MFQNTTETLTDIIEPSPPLVLGIAGAALGSLLCPGECRNASMLLGVCGAAIGWMFTIEV